MSVCRKHMHDSSNDVYNQEEMELSTQVVLHVNVVYTHSSTSFAVTPLLIVKEARNIRTFIVVVYPGRDYEQ